MIRAQLPEMVAGYIECALWASPSNDDGNTGEPMLDHSKFSDYTIDPVLKASVSQDCLAFWNANYRHLRDWDAGQAGHAFFLTRNRHGAGFWDRGFGTAKGRAALTEAAHVYGGTSWWADPATKTIREN